jgi:hypothetical protein
MERMPKAICTPEFRAEAVKQAELGMPLPASRSHNSQANGLRRQSPEANSREVPVTQWAPSRKCLLTASQSAIVSATAGSVALGRAAV